MTAQYGVTAAGVPPSGLIWTSGDGSPEGAVTASVGSIYSDVENCALYFKSTGSGSTGWVQMLTTVATSRILGRSTSGTGAVEALTGTQATAILDTVTSGAKGLAPASGGGTSNFLRADGSWSAPTAPDPLFAASIRFSTAFGRTTADGPNITAGGTFNDLVIAKTVVIVAPPGGGATVTGLSWTVGSTSVSLPFIFFFNSGSGSVTFTDEDTGSTASNRFALVGSSSVVVPSRGGALLMKVSMPAPISDTRWVIVARSN